MIIDYDSQRDNPREPLSTCNVTGLSMACNYMKPGSTSPDDLFGQANSPSMKSWIKKNVPGSSWIMQYFASNSANLCWPVLERLADEILNPDFECYFKGIPNYRAVEKVIKQDQLPILLGTTLTGAGHIILLVGIEEPNFVCHDPYGNALTNYKDANGAYVKYPYQFLWPKMLKDRALFFEKCS